MLRKIVIVVIFSLSLPTLLHAQSLDTPTNGSNVSGIGYVRGWKCTGGNLTFTIDNGPSAPLSYGGDRGDTFGVCGDINNGFITQFNWNLLSNGQHTIRVFDNGIQFAQSTFTTTNLGSEFLTEQSSSCQASLAGQNVTLTWQEDQQNYVITGASGGGGYPSVAGTWSLLMSYVGENCNFLSIPPDLPTGLSDTLTVTQNGKNLTIVTAPPSVTFTGDLETNGDFTTTNSPQTQTISSCTYAVTAGLGGNFLSGTGAFMINFSFVSGSCLGLSLPCSVNYAGSLTKSAAASVNETESTGEPSSEGAMDTIGGALDTIRQGVLPQ